MATENDFGMSDNIKLPDFNILSLRRLLASLDTTRYVLKVRSGLKLPPIGCKVRERACAGSYMCSLANVCHFVAGRSLFYVKKDWITMCAAINNPASCEFRAVIRFLLAIVTGDETWISYTNIESKRQSMQWSHSSSPKAKKCKQASYIANQGDIYGISSSPLLMYEFRKANTVSTDPPRPDPNVEP